MIKKKKVRKFKCYQTLYSAMKRDGVCDPGKTATLLLELFLENNGKLYAQKIVGRGMCEEGQFKVWREILIKKEWLIFDIEENRMEKDFTKHKAGTKLIPFLNKEKMATEEMASMKDLDVKADKDDLREMQARLCQQEEKMQQIAEAVIELQRNTAPPHTEEKGKNIVILSDKIVKLTQNNLN